MNLHRFLQRSARVAILCTASASLAPAAESAAVIRATRTAGNPIIREDMLRDDEGASINGPSLIRVPAWVKNPLGKYYLYFAHHAGKYLRLAYADQLEGPWKILDGGVQRLDAQTALSGHIASPDAVIDEQSRQIFLFYHGGNPQKKAKNPNDPDGEAGQISSVSVSTDGVHFTALNVVVAPAYQRIFSHGGEWFALNHSGMLRRAPRLGAPFEPVAKIIEQDIIATVDPAVLGEPGATPAANRPPSGPFRYSIRHVGVDVDGDRLVVYFSCVGHRPERILATVVEMKGAPETWRARGTFEVARPDTEAEGVKYPLAYSNGGISLTRVNELRDPGVLREGGDAWLVYSIAGEHGLGLARLKYNFSR